MDNSVFDYPKLLFFTNGNTFTGSYKGMNYILTPKKDKETGESSLTVAVWYGPFCSALSEMVAQTEMPLSEEGLEQSRVYLAEQYTAFCEQQK